MGWKDDTRIRDLEPYAKKHGYEQVIVIAIREGSERFDVNTYGKDKKLCDEAKEVGERIHELVVKWWI